MTEERKVRIIGGTYLLCTWLYLICILLFFIGADIQRIANALDRAYPLVEEVAK